MKLTRTDKKILCWIYKWYHKRNYGVYLPNNQNYKRKKLWTVLEKLENYNLICRFNGYWMTLKGDWIVFRIKHK